MASPEAAVVRDLVHRLMSVQPQVEKITDRRGHVTAASLESIDLRDSVLTNKDELNLVEAVQELPSLMLPRSSIGDHGVRVLMRAFKEGSRRGSTLRHLDLTDNGITQQGFEELTEALGTGFLSSLEHLIVSHNKLGEEGANMLARVLRTGHHSSLRGLDLSNCSIGTLGLVSLADAMQSGNFKSWGLQSLDLSTNAIGEHAVVSLTRAMIMGRLPHLTFLSLSQNEVGEQGTLALSRVLKSGKLSGLTHLHLSLCYLSNALVPIAQALEGVPDLQVLDVSGNHMGEYGSMALAATLRTGTVARLQHLNLSQCGIGAQDADFIMKAIEGGQVWGLRHLDLSYNPLDSISSTSSSNNSSLVLNDQGSVALVRLIQIGYLSRVEYMDLSHCSITDLGLIALAESMASGKLPILKYFLFKGNEIRNKRSIKALVRALESGHLAYLQELELGQNSVGEDATLALASALTVSSAQGRLVESLKNRLATSQKSLAVDEGTVGDQVKKVWRNKSFRALGVIRVPEAELPQGEKIYNRYLERQYSNRVAPVVDEDIVPGQPTASHFFFNVMFVCVWLLAVLVTRRF